MSANWKYGDPAPKGYGLVTLKVAVPGADRRTQTIVEAGNTANDAELQVLLYVKRPDGGDIYDAFGTKAIYMAPVDPSTGVATFRLPPLPASTLDPTVTPSGSNAHLFEIKVYKRSGPTDPLAADDQFGHLKAASGGVGDALATYASLTNKKLVASGETLSAVVPGLPVVVNVPKIFVHVPDLLGPDSGDADTLPDGPDNLNDNLDSFSNIKQISLATPPKQGNEVLIRVTNLDTSKLASGHVLTFQVQGTPAADQEVLTVHLASTDGSVDETLEVNTAGAADASAVAALIKTALGLVAEITDDYAIGGTGATITLTSKSMVAGLSATVTDESSKIANGNVTGGVSPVSAGFIATFSGSYAAYEVFNFQVKDGARTYTLSNISTDSTSLSAIAAEVASRANADDGTDNVDGNSDDLDSNFTITASGNGISFAARTSGTASNLDTAFANGITVADPTLDLDSWAQTQAEELKDPSDPASVPKPWKHLLSFGAVAPTAGDTLIVYTTRANGTPGKTFTYSAPDNVLDNFLNGAKAAIDLDPLSFPFLVTQDLGADTLLFEANEVPGSFVSSASIAPKAAALAAAAAATSVGVNAVAAKVDLDLDPGANGSGDTIGEGASTVNVSFSWTDLTGAPRTVNQNIALADTDTVADIVTALDGNTAFSDGFDASDSGGLLRIAANNATNIDPNSPSHNIPVAVTRTRAMTFLNGPTVASVDSYSHALRALLIWPSGTTFGATAPTLSVIDGNRTTIAESGLVGSYVKTLAGAANVVDTNLTIVNGPNSLTRLLDLNADISGVNAPTSGPWNFLIKLNGASAAPDFYLLDLDTGNGQNGSVVAQ